MWLNLPSKATTTKNKQNRPRIGIGIIIVNSEGKILIGKRINAHAPSYSIPGGHLECGETFEQTAIRETKEEVNLDITNPAVMAVTNNLETYHNEGLHYISIALLATEFSGELKNLEPDKCAEIFWCDPRAVPTPHFDASRLAIECYLSGKFYVGM